MVNVDLKFCITPQELDLDLGKVETVTEIVTETENDHSKLDNRHLPDQHPIESVTGLTKALDDMQTTADGLKIAVKEINEDVDDLNGDVDTLNSDMDGLENDVGKLNKSVGGLGTQVTGLATTVTKLSTSMEEVPTESLTNSEVAQIWNSVMGTL